MRAWGLVGLVGVVALLAAGCNAASPPDDPPPLPAVSLEELQTRLDSAAASFRAGNIALARDHYLAALEVDSTLAAAWFGVFMTERTLGNLAVADSALARAHRLADATNPD